MHVTFGPKGVVQIDNARITYRNFSGAGSKFNREGDRNFAVIIPDSDIADALVEDGWAVKIKPPREEGDSPFMFLKVKVLFKTRANGELTPNIYLVSNGNQVKLDEESVNCLDNIDIQNVDLDIRPYDWEVNGKTGRSAYLHAMRVTQEIDRFATRFTDDYSDEVPF